jgi:hypothetical protein
MNIIHTFGDSHSHHGFRNLNNYNIRMNHIGSKTMSNFGRFKLDLLDISKFNVQSGDYVCFCFGEIDCRSHVPKFKEKYKELIEQIVDSYIDAIKENIKNFSDLKVMIYNIPPTLRKSYENRNDLFPMIGTDEERIIYIKYMNDKLREQCEINKFIFFDVYDSYVGEDGFMKFELSDGCIHINNPIYIDEFLKKILSIK